MFYLNCLILIFCWSSRCESHIATNKESGKWNTGIWCPLFFSLQNLLLVTVFTYIASAHTQKMMVLFKRPTTAFSNKSRPVHLTQKFKFKFDSPTPERLHEPPLYISQVEYIYMEQYRKPLLSTYLLEVGGMPVEPPPGAACRPQIPPARHVSAVRCRRSGPLSKHQLHLI